MADLYTQASRGLVAAGPIYTFEQDTTAIAKGDAVILDGTNDLRVQRCNAASSKLCVGVAATDSKATSPTAGDEIAVVVRGPIVKVEMDGGTNDVAPGALMVTDTDGSFIELTAFDAPATYVEATVQTELDKINTVVGIALQNATNDGDEALMLLL